MNRFQQLALLAWVVVSILLLPGTVHSQQTPPSIEWQKSLGGLDGAYSIAQTRDGGYIVAGFSESPDGDVAGHHGETAWPNYWIVKLTSSGKIEWQKSVGGSGGDIANSIAQTNDGGYIVAGRGGSTDGDVTGNHGDSDYWIVKLSSTGMIEWEKSVGGSGADVARSIVQTSNGGYIVAGFSYSPDGDVTDNHGDFDYWIVKLTSTGEIEWEKSLGGSGGDQAYSIVQTSDSGYIVAGESFSPDGDVTGNHGGLNYWIVKLRSTGEIEWEKSLGGSGLDGARSIVQTSNGGYIVAGYSDFPNGDVTGNHGRSDSWIVKLTSTGMIEWQKSLGGSGDDGARSIAQTSDDGYIVAGSSESTDGDVTGNHGRSDSWIVKLTSTGMIEWQKSLGGSDDDRATSIAQTSDGGYIVAGYSEPINSDGTINYEAYDFWIVKLYWE